MTDLIMKRKHQEAQEQLKQLRLIKKLQPDHIPDVGNMVSCDICGQCNKLIEFDVDCQEMVEVGRSTETCKWVHNECLEEELGWDSHKDTF